MVLPAFFPLRFFFCCNQKVLIEFEQGSHKASSSGLPPSRTFGYYFRESRGMKAVLLKDQNQAQIY
jgi:hypothetical protein